MPLVSKALETTPSAKIVTLAAGCFWGVERVMAKYFQGKGLIDSKVGYANGSPSVESVSYKSVCSGRTGYAECLQVSYDSDKLKLQDILDIFFRIHDPTTFNSQGPDVGSQYRSGIFTHSAEDLEIAKQVKQHFQKEWYPNHTVVTVVEPIQNWYDAEEYHQKYLDRNPGGYECPTHFLRTKPKA